jgi:peptidoglycan hydrolase-like protein with peptidoglycan-binding domain
VRIIEVPSALIEINPQWRGHQYFVVRDEIVIVDHSRKIVAIVPVGSSGGAALHSGGGASSAAALNLTEEQIRQIQIVLNEKGFSIGRPDGRLGPRTIRALTEFQRRQGLSGRLDSRTVSALGVSNVSGAQGGGSQGAGQSSTTGQGGAAQHQAPAQQNQDAKEPSTSGQSGGQGGAAQQHTPSQQKEGASKPSTSGHGSSQQTPAQRLPNEQHENAGSK